MATFSIDNDRVTDGIQDVTYDQSAGVQTLATADDGNEVDVTLSGQVSSTVSIQDLKPSLPISASPPTRRTSRCSQMPRQAAPHSSR